MALSNRKKKSPEPAELKVQAYRLNNAGEPTLSESLSVNDLDAEKLEAILGSDPKPIITINYMKISAQDTAALAPYIGKRVILCSAAKFILKERVKAEMPELSDMHNILQGRYYMEGNKQEALYFELATLLDTKHTHTMSPGIFRAKLCEGIAKMAEALEDQIPKGVPDFNSIRVRNAFQENQIEGLSDLKGMQPHEILRMKNFGHKSIMTVFIGLLEMIRPAIIPSGEIQPQAMTTWA